MNHLKITCSRKLRLLVHMKAHIHRVYGFLYTLTHTQMTYEHLIQRSTKIQLSDEFNKINK